MMDPFLDSILAPNGDTTTNNPTDLLDFANDLPQIGFDDSCIQQCDFDFNAIVDDVLSSETSDNSTGSPDSRKSQNDPSLSPNPFSPPSQNIPQRPSPPAQNRSSSPSSSGHYSPPYQPGQNFLQDPSVNFNRVYDQESRKVHNRHRVSTELSYDSGNNSNGASSGNNSNQNSPKPGNAHPKSGKVHYQQRPIAPRQQRPPVLSNHRTIVPTVPLRQRVSPGSQLVNHAQFVSRKLPDGVQSVGPPIVSKAQPVEQASMIYKVSDTRQVIDARDLQPSKFVYQQMSPTQQLVQTSPVTTQSVRLAPVHQPPVYEMRQSNMAPMPMHMAKPQRVMKMVPATSMSSNQNIVLLDANQIHGQPGQTIQLQQNPDGSFQKVVMPEMGKYQQVQKPSSYKLIPASQAGSHIVAAPQPPLQFTSCDTIIQMPEIGEPRRVMKRPRRMEPPKAVSRRAPTFAKQESIENLCNVSLTIEDSEDDSEPLNKRSTTKKSSKLRYSSFEENMPPTPQSGLKGYSIDLNSDDEDMLDAPTPSQTEDDGSGRPIISRLIAGRRTNYQLSEEEISALKLEGIDPSEYQKGKLWTKTQEKVLKRIRRKIRNKRSAHESRRRKKMFMETMQAELQREKDQNKTLRDRVSELETQNSQLKTHVTKLKAFIAAASQRTAQATTCVMLLVLSLAFFLAPNYGPLSIFKQKTQAQKELQLNPYDAERNPAPPIFVSRRILQLVDEDGNPLDDPIVNEPTFLTDDEDGGTRSDSSISEIMRVKREALGLSDDENIQRQTKQNMDNTPMTASETSDLAGQKHKIMSQWSLTNTRINDTFQLSRNLTSGLRRRFKMDDVKAQNFGFVDSHSSLMPQEPAVYKQEMRDRLAL